MTHSYPSRDMSPLLSRWLAFIAMGVAPDYRNQKHILVRHIRLVWDLRHILSCHDPLFVLVWVHTQRSHCIIGVCFVAVPFFKFVGPELTAGPCP